MRKTSRSGNQTNTRHRNRVFYALLACVLLFSCRSGPGDGDKEAVYYAVEINGVLCGYAEFKVDTLEQDGRQSIHLDEHLYVMLKALGMEFDTDIELTYHIDPETGQFTYQAVDVKQGQTEMSSEVYVEGDTARVTSTLGSGDRRVALPPDVVLENTLTLYHLLRDFGAGGLDEKTYEIFETRGGEVQTTTYTMTGTETIELAGKTYQAMMFDQINHDTGLKTQWWIDAETGRMLKLIPMGNRVVYLSDPSVVKRIETANMDDLILTKANVTIADIPSISYMKIKASIEPVGLWVTPEGLNAPGQSFVGTVEENVIDGVFEIEHPRYDGSNAPPFPPDFGEDESLEPYLEASEFAQSDDPVLREKAEVITKGSADSWEAATRISQWVAENIGYAIPGGGTARKTYDTKAGECGAHSFLVIAFCRAVGIPARMVWGCMYTPQGGGSFGQHGWNEIYMGDAGWVPIDATAYETDFVDSGHIRIGVFQSPVVSFNAHALEILDHRLIGGEAEDTTGAGASYDAYAGKYRGPRGEIMTISEQQGSMTLDIPNKMVLAFHDPDEEGKWVCTLSNRLYLTFDKKSSGDVDEMWIHEIVDLPRKSDLKEIDDDVPEEYRPYLGVYHLAAPPGDFTVVFKDGSLAVYDPFEKSTVKLQGPDDKGRFLDEYNKNTISFERDDEGNVTTLVIDATSKCPRK
jgi:hypothetical protein